MSITTLIFTILIGLPRFHADTESSAERTARLTVIAQAIDSATLHATCTGDWAAADWCRPIWPAAERLDLAILIVTQGFWESRFAQRVHADQCQALECDPVKLASGAIFHRSKSVWQIQQTLVVPEWRSIGGLGEWTTYSAAYAAAKVLAAARGRCAREAASWVTGAISGYAGYTCQWPGAPRRAAFYHQLRSKASALAAEEAVKTAPAVASFP